ncbi:hypothetical protein EYF80_050010 [Liparis tanakae]|uniref:Uncharacterized protein n=1 Tax=Liparis tanakae TaxID=230148 RepID=A0A4Z2FF83_9TELE|nr:hypothetical protein EYF80_050010 [Liparis tanakae]
MADGLKMERLWIWTASKDVEQRSPRSILALMSVTQRSGCRATRARQVIGAVRRFPVPQIHHINSLLKLLWTARSAADVLRESAS